VGSGTETAAPLIGTAMRSESEPRAADGPGRLLLPPEVRAGFAGWHAAFEHYIFGPGAPVSGHIPPERANTGHRVHSLSCNFLKGRDTTR
jgi:hypothetical protein